MYIETELKLDSFDLIQIENLIKLRLKELREFKSNSDGWMPKALADEQISNYNVTMKKIKAARAEVKRIKEEADAAYYAELTARRAKSKRKPVTS